MSRIKTKFIEKKMINNLSTIIGLKCCKKYIEWAWNCPGFGKMSYIDTIEYYKTLTKNPEEITRIKIAETLIGSEKQKFLEDDENLVGLIGLVSNIGENYDVVYDSSSQIPNQHNITLSDQYDGYFDIVVHNASYAYLYYDNMDPNDVYNRKIPLEENYLNNTFTFTDITLENPLFPAISDNKLTIYTDGSDVTYKTIWINSDKNILNKFGNSYAITHFPKLDKVLFHGHGWQPSFYCSYKEIVDVPFKNVV